MTSAISDYLLRIRFELLGLVLIAALALSYRMDEPPLVNWDEATYAEVVHESITSGSYLDFTWNGETYLKKPPLLFWIMSASFGALGESEMAARLPSIIMGIGTIVVVYFAVALEFGRLAGLFAGLLPLTFYFFVARGGRECATDAPLVFFSTLAIFAFMRSKHRRTWLAVAGVACGLAILSKGLAGLIPLTAIGLAASLESARRAPAIRSVAVVAVIAALVAAPWFIYTALQHGAAFWETYVKQETLMRLATHLEDVGARPATLTVFGKEVVYLWPLILPLIGVTISGLRKGKYRPPAAVTLWVCWLVVALAAAYAVQTKLEWYILPALIPTAMLAGSLLGTALSNSGAERRYCIPLGSVALIAIAWHVPARWRDIQASFKLQRDRSRPSYIMGLKARNVAIERASQGQLYIRATQMPTLVYYSGLHCHFLPRQKDDLALTDVAGDAVDLRNGELVFMDSSGESDRVADLTEEWNREGPLAERAGYDNDDSGISR